MSDAARAKPWESKDETWVHFAPYHTQFETDEEERVGQCHQVEHWAICDCWHCRRQREIAAEQTAALRAALNEARTWIKATRAMSDGMGTGKYGYEGEEGWRAGNDRVLAMLDALLTTPEVSAKP